MRCSLLNILLPYIIILIILVNLLLEIILLLRGALIRGALNKLGEFFTLLSRKLKKEIRNKLIKNIKEAKRRSPIKKRAKLPPIEIETRDFGVCTN